MSRLNPSSCSLGDSGRLCIVRRVIQLDRWPFKIAILSHIAMGYVTLAQESKQIRPAEGIYHQARFMGDPTGIVTTTRSPPALTLEEGEVEEEEQLNKEERRKKKKKGQPPVDFDRRLSLQRRRRRREVEIRYETRGPNSIHSVCHATQEVEEERQRNVCITDQFIFFSLSLPLFYIFLF